MINKNFIQKDTNLSWDEISNYQREGNFILPSDFVCIGINYNNLTFNINPNDNFKINLANGKLTSFDILYNIRELRNELFILNMYQESDGIDFTDKFLPIANNGQSGVFFIGCNAENLNAIYYFDPSHHDDTNNLGYWFFKQADNIFQMLNEQIFNPHPA